MLVAEGHITKAPATITYASDVSRETVSIAVIIAALTNLEVKLGDILYAYVQAPVTGKVRTTFSSEFGKGASKTAVIVRALYGLKSAGSAFRSRVVRCMIYLECAPCKANSDFWLKPETRPDGAQYYSYLLCYVDDILCIHDNADAMLKWLHVLSP